MEKLLEALVIMISEFLRKRNGEKCKLGKWSYVLDFLSTPRREMETLLRGMPQSTARDDAIEALNLPEKTVRRPSKKTKSEAAPADEEATSNEEDETQPQLAKRKRTTAKGVQKPRKKASKAKKRSKASASDNDADDGDAIFDQDDSNATVDGDGSHRAPDPLRPIFIYDFPTGAHRTTTPSERLLCGLVALIDSIRHHHEAIPRPTVPQLQALVTVLGIQDTGNFDSVQLGRILAAWGRIHRRVLQLGYVVGGAYFLHGLGTREADHATRVWIHNDNAQQSYDGVRNHWSGLRHENGEDDDDE